jgi:hypothetical protein
MLEIGNGNLTLAENRAHFALWAAMKSPLIIGTAVYIYLSPAKFSLPNAKPQKKKKVNAG